MQAPKQIPPTGVRLPDDLRQWLRDQANENQRTLTGQIVWALQQFRKQEEAKATS